MSDIRKINQSEYQRAVNLLAKLFEEDSDVEKQINGYIIHFGIQNFFENLEATELTGEILQNLKAVRAVLFGLDEKCNEV